MAKIINVIAESVIASSFNKAETLIERGYAPVAVGGDKEDKLLGLLFEDKFVFRWACGSIDFQGLALPNGEHTLAHQQEWVDGYTIRRADAEAWDRLVKVADTFESGSCDPDKEAWGTLFLNNWWEMAHAIKSGEYTAEYNESGDAEYRITDEVLSVVEDKTPTWEDIKLQAVANFPEIKDYVYPNSWEGLHNRCSDILSAAAGEKPSPYYKEVICRKQVTGGEDFAKWIVGDDSTDLDGWVETTLEEIAAYTGRPLSKVRHAFSVTNFVMRRGDRMFTNGGGYYL